MYGCMFSQNCGAITAGVPLPHFALLLVQPTAVVRGAKTNLPPRRPSNPSIDPQPLANTPRRPFLKRPRAWQDHFQLTGFPQRKHLALVFIFSYLVF